MGPKYTVHFSPRRKHKTIAIRVRPLTSEVYQQVYKYITLIVANGVYRVTQVKWYQLLQAKTLVGTTLVGPPCSYDVM